MVVEEGATVYFSENCLVCGAEVSKEGNLSGTECYFCGAEMAANGRCALGHSVCNSCHDLPANDVVRHLCTNSQLTNPLELALSVMRSPKIRMHGPEHHFLVPAALLAAYYNLKDAPALKEEKIKVAQERAVNVLGGFCGYYGSCGAAVGTGIFVSLITEATPLSQREWRLSNLMTSRSLLAVANSGGPRCCKRDSFLSIIEAAKFLREYFEVELPLTQDIKCEFNHLNLECLADECRFYRV